MARRIFSVCVLFVLLTASMVVRAGDLLFPEFVENKGQWDAAVKFRAELPGGVFWAEENGFLFSVLGNGWSDLGHDSPGVPLDPDAYRMHHYRVRFEGSTIPAVAGENPANHHYNYYIGDDTTRWAKDVKPYSKARYTGIYEGIDLVVYGKNQRLKYDFKVQPNADPNAIELVYDGVDSLAIVNGNLIVYTSVREVVELEPYAYQLNAGMLNEVECSFQIEGNRVRFALGDYDPGKMLVIDPEIAFSTLVGATASNFGFTATDDLDGNLIAGACVFAAGYPTTLGAVSDDFSFILNSNCDAAVSKFSADGSELLYSTYLGGNGLEMPHSVIADSEGNFVVMGTTGSTNFPVTAGVFQPTLAGGPVFSFASFFLQASHGNGCDFFISKFNSDDSGLIASTYIGGTDTDGMNMGDKLFYNYGDAFRGEVIVDEDDNIIVASTTNSADFPMVGGGPQQAYSGNQDGVVFMLNPDLTTLLWSTFVGGPQPDAAYSVQIDSEGALVVTGGTKSATLNMPGGGFQNTFAGDVDAFVYRYTPDGSAIAAGTFFGTELYDQAYFVQIDAYDNIYLFGQSDGDLEVQGDVYSNPGSGQFVVKFDHNLQNQEWLTTIGTGSGVIDISPTAFLVSDCDQIYLAGWGGLTNVLSAPYAIQSTTEGMPVTDNAFQATTDGSDFYLCVLEPDATALTFATFFGGALSREHVDGGTSKFDKNGSVYQAVCAGCGGNSDFPTTPGAWSANNLSTNCNLGVFKFDLAVIEAGIGIDGPTEICQFAEAGFTNESAGADTFLWDFGDGSTSGEENPSHSFSQPGTYTVSLMASHTMDCVDPDIAFLTITVIPSVELSVDQPDPICDGASIQLNATGSPNLYWLDDPTLSSTEIPNPIATPTEPETSYFVVDNNECSSDTLEIVVILVQADFDTPDDPTICVGESVSLTLTGGWTYLWQPANSLNTASGATVIASPSETTEYTINITTSEGCEFTESITVFVDQNAPGGEQYPDTYACVGEPVGLGAANGIAWSWSPSEFLNNAGLQYPAATVYEDTWFQVEVINACGSGTDSVYVVVVIPQAFAGTDGAVCRGEQFPVWAAGGESYFWTPQAFVTDPTEAETSVTPNESMTFTAYVTDEFGCTATAEVNVTVLPLPYVNAGPDRVLEWLESDYLFGTADGVEWWWEPDLFLDCPECITAITSPEESMWYTLFTIDGNGCRNADSVYVDVFHPLFVPNTFTPDNDGINDIFKASGVNVRGFRMEIRNRWGELIFVSEDINKGWDGSVNGGDYFVQIDTYIWTVYYDTKDGRKKLEGHVNVIR